MVSDSGARNTETWSTVCIALLHNRAVSARGRSFLSHHSSQPHTAAGGQPHTAWEQGACTVVGCCFCGHARTAQALAPPSWTTLRSGRLSREGQHTVARPPFDPGLFAQVLPTDTPPLHTGLARPWPSTLGAAHSELLTQSRSAGPSPPRSGGQHPVTPAHRQLARQLGQLGHAGLEDPPGVQVVLHGRKQGEGGVGWWEGVGGWLPRSCPRCATSQAGGRPEAGL